MKDHQELWPIVRKFEAYRDYPFEAIGPEALETLSQANKSLANEQKKQFKIVLRALECFLQITNQHIVFSDWNSCDFSKIYRTFIGALNSPRFISRPFSWRYAKTRAFNELIVTLQLFVAVPKREVVPVMSGELSPEIQLCVSEFENLTLDEEKTLLWRGWISESKRGGFVLLPLYPIYRRLGKKFTDRLFDVCDTYIAGRRHLSLQTIRPLSTFIGQYEKLHSADDFNDPQFTTEFWNDFYVYYMVMGYRNGEGLSPTSLAIDWGRSYIPFINTALENSGLFAKTWGELPAMDIRRVPGSKTHIKKSADGQEVKTKLLTDIPLQVSDEEALELLFHDIEADFNIFYSWAEKAADDLWKRHEWRKEPKAEGTVRHIQQTGIWHHHRQNWLTNRKNPSHLSNAAVTFEHYGFQTNFDIRLRSLYPCPLYQTALDLGLPVTDALIPHCILLVAEHNEITPAFLEQFELFDKNGNQSGFVETNGNNKLIGYKHRRGAKHAEQKIDLSEHSTNIVRQIIKLTAPLREYLKARGDDNWRYLLLTCKQGFAYPAPIRALSQATTVPIRIKAFADRLAETCDLSIDQRITLIRRFSLTTFRASAGVLVYLRTGSVEEMAKALGHLYCSANLLSSYLPQPILDFFQERWVRLFQTGIIVEAMKDSDHLLASTEFKTMSELDEFLRHHALRILPANLTDPCGQDQGDTSSLGAEVVFGINTGILIALISLQMAVEQASKQVCAKAKYWAEISKRLVLYMRTALDNRVDLQNHLVLAQQKADPSLMRSLIYG